MTDDTTAPDEVEPPQGDPSPPVDADLEDVNAEDLGGQSRAAKVKAAEVLHAYGDRRGHCATFDRILSEVGIPVRRREEHNVFEPTTLENVQGEPTAEEHEAWRLNASRGLLREGDRHGVPEITVRDLLREAGLPVRERRPVHIEGSFAFDLEVKGFENEDLISLVPTSAIRDRVYYAIGDSGNPDATWKATIPETEQIAPTQDAPA
jgi:hypothetical protein